MTDYKPKSLGLDHVVSRTKEAVASVVKERAHLNLAEAEFVLHPYPPILIGLVIRQDIAGDITAKDMVQLSRQVVADLKLPEVDAVPAAEMLDGRITVGYRMY